MRERTGPKFAPPGGTGGDCQRSVFEVLTAPVFAVTVIAPVRAARGSVSFTRSVAAPWNRTRLRTERVPRAAVTWVAQARFDDAPQLSVTTRARPRRLTLTIDA